MKIFWFHDWRLSEWLGGATLTNEILVANSPYEIEQIYPNTFSRQRLDGHLIILNNCPYLGKNNLSWIVETQRFIAYEHGYDYCSDGTGGINHDCLICDNIEFWQKLFNNSLLNIFLSPLHYNTHKKYFKFDEDKVHLQPSPIDVERFRYNGPKEDIVLGVGEDGFHKGTDIAKERYPSMIFLGGNNKVPYAEIHKWYHKAKYFVHLPRCNEPFGRTVAEAYCARCELICNDRVGFLSYPWDYNDYEFVLNQINIQNTSEMFWNKVKIYTC